MFLLSQITNKQLFLIDYLFLYKKKNLINKYLFI